jgi:hypothetical protein
MFKISNTGNTTAAKQNEDIDISSDVILKAIKESFVGATIVDTAAVMAMTVSVFDSKLTVVNGRDKKKDLAEIIMAISRASYEYGAGRLVLFSGRRKADEREQIAVVEHKFDTGKGERELTVKRFLGSLFTWHRVGCGVPCGLLMTGCDINDMYSNAKPLVHCAAMVAAVNNQIKPKEKILLALVAVMDLNTRARRREAQAADPTTKGPLDRGYNGALAAARRSGTTTEEFRQAVMALCRGYWPNAEKEMVFDGFVQSVGEQVVSNYMTEAIDLINEHKEKFEPLYAVAFAEAAGKK